MLKFTTSNFEEEVLKSDKKVLVDFFATWCGPCQMLSPIIDEISKEHPEIKVGKVDVDEEPALAREYGIVSIPFVALFNNGKLEKSFLGLHSKEEVIDFIK